MIVAVERRLWLNCRRSAKIMSIREDLESRKAFCVVTRLPALLIFHWKGISLPADVLKYLVAHKLAHIKQRNHTKEFWSVVEKKLLD